MPPKPYVDTVSSNQDLAPATQLQRCALGDFTEDCPVRSSEGLVRKGVTIIVLDFLKGKWRLREAR